MTRYIDADLVKQIANSELGSSDKETVQWVIAHTPTADVQEVRHGRWILRGGWSRCSECDERALLKDIGGTGGFHEYDQVRSNICPHCGAKMDGKE